MRKFALIVALFVLLAAVTASAAPMDDKEFRAGLKYYNSRDFKAAVSQFQDYVNRHPDPAAYYLIGYSLYKLGKFSESAENFRQAYLLAPDFSLEKAGLITKSSEEIMTGATAKSKKRVARSESKTGKGRRGMTRSEH